MAPPKSYMIPLQFPAGLYDYAEPPGPFANWTSAPLYSYEQFTRANPRQGREKRAPRKGRAHRNGASEAYDVASNAGPFLPGMFPYGAMGRPAAYGPSGYEAAERRAKPNGGKYADVMKAHGRKGFGLPEKAPNEGSFPLYPIKRARYALAVVAAPAFDSHPEERERVIRAAVERHPKLKKEAEHVLQRVGMRMRKAAANPRHKKYPFYVIRKSDGEVLSGWDYREDAQDDLRENREHYPEAKVSTHAGVERQYGKVVWARTGR